MLQDFAATAVGQQLVAAAARATGASAADLLTDISTLPLLDFYVPARADRRAWKGTVNLTAAVALGRDLSTVAGYDPSGKPRQHTGRNRAPWATSAGPVLFLLHRAEPKGQRIDPQPSGPGSVIQDPGDGEIAAHRVSDSPPEAALALHGLPSARSSGPATGGANPTVQTCEENPSQSFCDIEVWETDDGSDDFFGTATLTNASDVNRVYKPGLTGKIQASWNWTP